MPLSYIGPQVTEVRALANQLWREAGYNDGDPGRSRFLRLVTELPPQKMELFQVYAVLVMEDAPAYWARILVWGFYSEHQSNVKVNYPDEASKFQDCWPDD